MWLAVAHFTTRQSRSPRKNFKFYSAASCAEAQETKIFYELKFQLWGKVKENYQFQKKPVGKFLFTLEKDGAPTRWRQLYKEGTKKPPTMKLDIDKLQ